MERRVAEARLKAMAGLSDAAIDLTEAALTLAALTRPRVPLARYRDHLARLAADLAAVVAADPDGAGDAATAAELLAGVIARNHGYAGDELTYDDPQNANLIRVIDRRKGLPVALGIIYLHVARAQGWTIEGLAFPGHFLLALERPRGRAIVDPFHGGRTCAAADLRALLKTAIGPEAELAPEHYAPVGNRAILLRLQNNVKLRRLQSQDAAGALVAIDSMLWFAPGEAGLWHEAGLLHGTLGNFRAAVGALERCQALAPDDRTRHRLAVLLQDLRGRLH